MSQASSHLIFRRYDLPPVPHVQDWVESILGFVLQGGDGDVPWHVIGELKALTWKLKGFVSECGVSIETVLLRRRFEVLIEKIEGLCLGGVPAPSPAECHEMIVDATNTYHSILVQALEHLREKRPQSR